MKTAYVISYYNLGVEYGMLKDTEKSLDNFKKS